MKLLRLIDNALTRVVNIALVSLFSLLMSLAFVQVFLRYFFNSSILWGDIAGRTLVIWVGFLGAVLATRENKHFHIDVLTRFLRERYQLWFQSLSNLFASVICFLLGQASQTYLNIEGQSKTFLELPVSVVELVIPLGFYLMMFQFALRTVIMMIEGIRLPSSLDDAETP